MCLTFSVTRINWDSAWNSTPVYSQWAQINFSMLSRNFPQPSSTLIFGWEIVDSVTMINQKSTSQPQFNQKSTMSEVEISMLKNGWDLVDSLLILGWEVDFWLRNWPVPIGLYLCKMRLILGTCWYLNDNPKQLTRFNIDSRNYNKTLLVTQEYMYESAWKNTESLEQKNHVAITFWVKLLMTETIHIHWRKAPLSGLIS